jgi:hypothetical protein
MVDVEDRVEVSSERFNGIIAHININLAAFREVMPRERLKELLKTPLEKSLSIYAYSLELEIFNWAITRRNAYKRLESFRLAIKAELKRYYNVGPNEGSKACWRVLLGWFFG